MYIAGRHVNVERDGKLVSLPPGAPVPEAAEWPTDVRLRCMRIGQIAIAPEGYVDPNAAKHTKPAKKKSAA